MLQRLSPLLLLGLIVGCAGEKTFTFDVAVRNDTNRPITVWLTKDGPPAERNWIAPEDLVMHRSADDERVPGAVLIEAGKTASTGKVTAKFEPDTLGWLRVYEGELTQLSEFLALSRGSSRRLDLPLRPGVNRWTVFTGADGRLMATKEGDSPPPK